MSERTPGESAGLMESLTAVGATLVGMAHTRLDLLSTDLEEARDGSSLVDVSPLSTLGALCVAAVPDPLASRRLFQSLLAWGLSMTLVGALLCQFFAGWLAGA